MKSLIVKHSIAYAGLKTSVSLENAFWKGLREIAAKRNMTVSDLVGAIDSERQHGNRSSAIRLFVLDFYRDQLSVERESTGINRPAAAANQRQDQGEKKAPPGQD